MLFDTTDPTYQELLGRVVQSDARVVPFVGAGLSLFGDPEDRLPLWGELVRRILEEGRSLLLVSDDQAQQIERALTAAQPIAATDKLLDAVGPVVFRRLVERELNDAGRPSPPGVASLVAIGWSLIVTTNLDRFIPREYLKAHGVPIRSVTGLDTHGLVSAFAGIDESSGASLARIHGDIDMYPSWVLTTGQYQRQMNDDGYMEALKHLFLRRLFFIGFGLQDRDFDLLLDLIRNIYPAGAGELFALLPEPRRQDERVIELIRNNGLRPIFYPLENLSGRDPYGGHRALHECLDHLARAWASATVSLPVLLQYFPGVDPTFVGRTQALRAISEELLRSPGGALQVVGLGGLGKTALVQHFVETSKPDIAQAGIERVMGFSLTRAEIGECVRDLELACTGSSTLPLPIKVARVCDYLRAHRVLLVLDGMEVLVTGDARLDNSYVSDIIRATRAGGGSVLSTSRVQIEEASELGRAMDLPPLSSSDVERFIDASDLSGPTAAERAALVTTAAGHPLALRVLVGMATGAAPGDLVETMAMANLLGTSDDLEPDRPNPLTRILESYEWLLNADELAFMTSWTAFLRLESYPVIEKVLTRDYVEPCINGPLIGQDLRGVIQALRQKGLLTATHTGQVAAHPILKAYFRRRAVELGEVLPLHRELATRYLSQSEELPSDMGDAVPLVTGAHHAALSGQWSLFDDAFRRRLMRGNEAYLCDSVGAWDEALNLARLGLPPGGSPQLDRAFYQGTVARCLKHLGHSEQSLEAYRSCLAACVSERNSDSARYINNALTLLVWRGNLGGASQLVDANFAALAWVDNAVERRWQFDQASSSVAYLRLLQGSPDEAASLFRQATEAWRGIGSERPLIYDHYPIHVVELRLLMGQQLADVKDELVHWLGVARANKWAEAECRTHLAMVDAYLWEAAQSPRPGLLVDTAHSHLEAARSAQEGLAVTDVAIQAAVAELKHSVTSYRLLGDARVDGDDIEARIDGAERLARDTGLLLSEPEFLAARGHLAVARGDSHAARTLLSGALKVCGTQGNWLYANSPRYLTGSLNASIGAPAEVDRNPIPVARSAPKQASPPPDEQWIGSAIEAALR